MASFFTNTKLSRRIRRREGSKETNRFEWIETPCRVDLEIDTEAILKTLGQKAINNKSLSAIALSGLIKVTVRPLEPK